MADASARTRIAPGPAPARRRRGRPGATLVEMLPADAEAGRRLGERMSAELADLLRTVPIERRSVSDMSRWLGVTRPICQRLSQAARHRGDPLRVLTMLPGVQGLASFIRAARDAGCDKASVDAVEAAISRYCDLIDRHGGSQLRLIAAIEALQSAEPASAPAAGPTPAGLRARQQLFEGARAVTGRHIEAQVGLFIYRPVADAPDRIDCVTALGLFGAQAPPGAMPICPMTVFAHGHPDDAPDDLSLGPLGESNGSAVPVGRLDRFCSDPPPRVIARRRGGRASVLVETPSGEPIDVVLAARFAGVPHPALHKPRMQTCFVNTDGPPRRLLIAVHLHRSLAMRSVAMTGAYIRDRVGARLPGPGGHVHVLTPQELWYDRLPDVPTLEYLGLGLEQAETRVYARQRELLDALFELEGWSPDEFVGYRIQVEYPVWNAQYLIHFDFERDET